MPLPPFRCFDIAAICLAALTAIPSARAEEAASRGQLSCLPVYSEVPYGDKDLTLNRTATLSVRNTDFKNPIPVKRVDYHSAAGALFRSYLKQPATLKPLASAVHIVKESDRSGGISASFPVEWESETPVSPPFVEAIMVNSTYNQGIAFSSPARVLADKR
jgi:hypothetical protein